MNSDFTCDLCSKCFTLKRNLKRHQLLHEGKIIQCPSCEQTFTRKCYLKKHVCENVDELQCLNCEKTFSNMFNLKRHSNKCDAINYSEKEKLLTKQVLAQTEDYKSQIEMGKMLTNILNSNANVEEAALNETQKKALQLFQSSNTLNFNQINLRPWQKDLESYFDKPTFRKIIWVIGQNGNEGKTFFQKYIKSTYGTRRVFLINMVKRSENIFHILSKQTLTCKDIFFFNLAKSFSILDCAYNVFETIKDGHAVSSKYDSSNLTFKTPNTVMVFSNKLPFTNALSSDRWQIFRIVNNHLVATDCTNKSSFSKISKNESSDELDESDEELNEKSDSSSFGLKCRMCNEKFSSDILLYRHIKEKHENS